MNLFDYIAFGVIFGSPIYGLYLLKKISDELTKNTSKKMADDLKDQRTKTINRRQCLRRNASI